MRAIFHGLNGAFRTRIDRGYANFNGGGAITVANNAALQITGDLTLEFNFRSPDTTFRRGILNKGSISTEFSVHYESFGFVFHYGNGTANQQIKSSVGTIKPGAWVHCAIVRDMALLQIRYYINGVLHSTTPMNLTTVAASASSVLIGNNFRGNMIGHLDLVRIWNVVRTQAQINDNKGILLEPTAGLVAQYGFDNNAQDSSGNNFHGTAGTGVTFK